MWLGYLGLFVILIIALQLIIGGLVGLEFFQSMKNINFCSV